MQQKKDNWVLGIEQDVGNAPYNRVLWGFILLLSGIVFYFLNKRPDILGGITSIINLILILAGLFAFFKVIESPNNPNYLSYYLYQIGYELPDFEIENSYLKRNQKYIKNCSKQIRYLRNDNFQQTEYFIDNILDFLDSLDRIILRLNHIYTKENIDEALLTKLNETTLNLFTTKRDVISSKIIELARLIRKNNSSLTQEHVSLTNEILKELEGILEKPFSKPISQYFKEIWDKLPYKLKFLIFGATIFTIIFAISSQILMYYGQGQQSYTTAMSVSAVLTATILTKIDRFIAR